VSASNESALSRQEIHARAAHWRERRDRPDWNEQDQKELDVWLSESPAYAVAYLRVDSVWNRADRLNALRSPDSQPTTEATQTSKGSAVIKIVAMLAIVMLSAGGASYYYLQQPKQQTYTTTIGGHETLSLDDGSQIELNTDTVLRVSYNSNRRTVFLDKGEAYFQIAHNAARPFDVLAGNHRILDLGTKFLVRRDDDRLEVALTEGRAQLEELADAERHRTILAPGDVASAVAGAVSVKRKSRQALMGELGWRNGMLLFRDASIAQVVEELNRYNRKKLVVVDPGVARLTIGANIPTNGVEAFTRVAHEVFGLHAVNRGDEIVISR